jgi:alanine dehydrogenase
MALLLSRSDVQALLTMPDCIAIVEEAFRQLALGNVIMPQRTAIRMTDLHGLQLGMPAYIGGDVGALALKVVTVYPDNPSKYNKPTTIGILLLNDAATGEPLAVMDAGFLTGMRTGAVSGVATKHLAKRDARTVGLFGAGVMARMQLMAVCAVRGIESVMLYDTNAERARSFADDMSKQLNVAIEPVGDPRMAVEGMDIIIAASSAVQPIFDGAWLQPGQHINGIGSHAPTARELDTLTIQRSKLFPDYLDACLAEAGDFILPLNEGAITRDHFHASLGEVIAGLRPGRESDEEITLFKSVGLAIQDVATANTVYRKALDAGMGGSFVF